MREALALGTLPLFFVLAVFTVSAQMIDTENLFIEVYAQSPPTINLGDILVALDGIAGGQGIVIVDPANGQQTFLFELSDFSIDMKTDSAGDLIIAHENGVVRVDPNTGVETEIANVGDDLLIEPIGMDLNAAGEIIVLDAGDADVSLIKVDPVSGFETLIASGGLLASADNDLAVEPSGDIIVLGDGNLIRINPITASQTELTENVFGGTEVLIINDAGVIFAAGNEVVKINPITGSTNIISSGFNEISGIGIEPDGNIIVIDTDIGSTIYRVHPDTGAQSLVSSGDLLEESFGTALTVYPFFDNPDDDNDGIFDEVDTQPNTFSNDFSDMGLSGTTTGTITARGDQTLRITEEANPEGVRIKSVSAGGSISFDDVTSFNGVCGNPVPCSFSHTVSSGSNKVLIVGVAPKGGQTVTSVTYGGSALLPIRSDDDGGTVHSSLWYLLDPLPVGPNSVDVVLSSKELVVIGAMSFTDVAQTAINNHAGNTGKSTNPTVDIATTVNNAVIVDVVGTFNGPLTAGLGQTERWEQFKGSILGGGSTETTTISGTFTMDWTNLAGEKEWAISAAELIPQPKAAIVDICSGVTTINLDEDDEFVVTCSSVTIKVENGQVEVTFSAEGTTASATIPQGNQLTFEPETFTFTAPITNTDPITVLINGGSIIIEPGQVVDVDPITKDIDDNLEVGEGEIITVSNEATVSGNIIVDGGTIIISDGATVKGNVEAKSGASVSIGNSFIYGNVKIEDSGSSLELSNNSIKGNVETKEIDSLTVIDNNIDGNIKSENDGSVTISGNTVDGDIEIL